VDGPGFDALARALRSTGTRRALAGLLGVVLAGRGVVLNAEGRGNARQRRTRGRAARRQSRGAVTVAVCHRTGSDPNQYVDLQIPMSAAYQHAEHHGDAIGVDLGTSHDHCGACGHTCGEAECCVDGTCRARATCGPTDCGPIDDRCGGAVQCPPCRTLCGTCRVGSCCGRDGEFRLVCLTEQSPDWCGTNGGYCLRCRDMLGPTAACINGRCCLDGTCLG
jgi:hypothetical protein